MRILILSQWFQPEPFLKGLQFAKALMAEGHDVQVLTGFPNYPGGNLYPGYRIRPWARETMDGVPIIRVALYPSHDNSALRRAANYASFSLSATLIGSLLVRRADVMYVYHPPATVAVPAMVISVLRRIPFVYDIQDLWPDTLASTGMIRNRAFLGLVGAWCRMVYRRAARIVVLSPGFETALVARGVPEWKVDVIPNWCDETHVVQRTSEAALVDQLGLAGTFVVVFAGTMGKAQALDSVLDAAALVAGREPSVRFLMIGGGIEVDRLKKRAAGAGLANVQFVPAQPPAQIGRYLALADVLLVHLRDDPLFEITIPSKTQAYLAAGKPVLMAVRGDAAELIRRAEAGVVCEPQNPEAMARAIEELCQMTPHEREAMGERGRQFYTTQLSQTQGIMKFERLFRTVGGGVDR